MKHANSIGDEIEVVTKTEKFKGRFVQDSNGYLILKLSSGYNVGIEKKRIQAINLLKKFKPKQVAKLKVAQKKSLKTVAILHTGGTISSAVDYATGGVTPRFTPEELLAMFPEVKDIVNIRSRLVRNMASDDMRFAHYNILAKEIYNEIKAGVDGVIITHGTDTMHYTATALSFIIENLPVPVVLIGAQRSSDRGSSDAAMNLISACYFIAKTDYRGVTICMHKTMNDDVCVILPGLKSRKMHSSRRDAFKAINSSAIAEVEYPSGKIKFLQKHYHDKEKNVELKLFNEKLKIGLVKAHPQMFATELDCYNNFDGLVLEGTGLGHFPITKIDEFTAEHVKIKQKIKELAKKMPVVMATQTIYGRVQMNVYGGGREIQSLGVIGNYHDMTPETAFIKLAWLLSNYPHKVKELISVNLKGEINERLLP